MTDPMIHLIRNATDHGLEDAKGRGMDPERIFTKAVQLGWVKQDQRNAYSSTQIYDFLFSPGFSTAEKVPDISGRGVGLDVVRTNVTQIGGSISIESTVGVGTTFHLVLPLTTGLKESLIVQSGQSYVAIPIEQVLESVKIKTSDYIYPAG